MDAFSPEGTATSETPRPRGRWRALVIAVLVGVFGVSTYGLGRAQTESPAPLSTDEPAAAVAEVLAPSVVRIEHQGGQGSGVTYDDGGLILTAGHVVRGTSSVTITTSEGDTMTGEVLGIDLDNDIAVVRAEGSIPVANLAEGIEIRVGETAIAIGSPYGLDETVTMGIVSALDRSVTTQTGTIDGLIQTDAPINPGNSGGPLANDAGQVIGINHAIATSSGGNQGVGFAIPIEAALASAEKILSGDATDPEDQGFMPDFEFPDEPFGGLDELREQLPESFPDGACGRGWLDAAPFEEPPGFRFDPPEVPMPRYAPDGYQTRSITTNTRDEDDLSDVLHEIELASDDARITISLGNIADLLEQAEDLRNDDTAESTAVDGETASLVDAAGRRYLVFEYRSFTGIIDAPVEVAGEELVRIAESIER